MGQFNSESLLQQNSHNHTAYKKESTQKTYKVKPTDK